VPAPGAGNAIGESAASHLAGLSQGDIHDIDEKFQRLLDTVHANRPGDDLEIIRKAWQFCLQQHEGQKRASGEPGGRSGTSGAEDGLDGDCGGTAA
jgi:GTP pyrophosphokinase